MLFIKRLSICVIAAIILFLAGCNSKDIRTTSQPFINSTISVQTTISATQNTQKTAPPKQLEAVESNAEDIIDDINSKNWTKAQSRVSQLKTNFNELKTILAQTAISSASINGIAAAVSDLEKEVTAKKVNESKEQANQITKFIPDIADKYKSVLPTDLGRLDYLGREIALNSEAKDWTSATGNLENAKSIWSSLKVKLSASYKNDSEKFQSSLDNLSKDINKKDASLTNKEANILLDLVDVLETDFSKQ